MSAKFFRATSRKVSSNGCSTCNSLWPLNNGPTSNRVQHVLHAMAHRAA